MVLLATMTSRRIISGDKTLFDKDERTNSPSASEKSNITPAVPAWVVLLLLHEHFTNIGFMWLTLTNLSRAVIYKLLGFTLAMIAGPIGTYFLTLNSIFRGWSYTCYTAVRDAYSYGDIGNSTWAGATAAFMANMVLIAYVIVAMKEDESDKLAAEEKARKGK